jgi:hypothetical protein
MVPFIVSIWYGSIQCKYLLNNNSNHIIYLQWTITITSPYTERHPYHILTMNGTISYTYNEQNHIIYLQWTITITSTFTERQPYHLLTMNGNHSIYLHWTITILSTYNERHQYHLLTMKGTISSTYNERQP